MERKLKNGKIDRRKMICRRKKAQENIDKNLRSIGNKVNNSTDF